eukprot:4494915-Pleurochrysis_carterae.AAC.1
MAEEGRVGERTRGANDGCSGFGKRGEGVRKVEPGVREWGTKKGEMEERQIRRAQAWTKRRKGREASRGAEARAEPGGRRERSARASKQARASREGSTLGRKEAKERDNSHLRRERAERRGVECRGCSAFHKLRTI